MYSSYYVIKMIHTDQVFAFNIHRDVTFLKKLKSLVNEIFDIIYFIVFFSNKLIFKPTNKVLIIISGTFLDK